MVALDPILIFLSFSALSGLFLIAAVVRGRGMGLHAGPGSRRTFALLLAFLLGWLGWVIIQGLARLHALRLVIAFDQPALARIGLYILFGLAVLIHLLTRHFVRREGPARRLGLAALAGLGLILLLYENPLRLGDLLLLPASLTPGGRYGLVRVRAAFFLLACGWASWIGSAAVLTLAYYRRAVSPLHRNRIQYWSIALLLVSAGGGLALEQHFLTWEPPLVSPAPWLLLLGILAYGLAAAAVIFTLLNFHLPDLRLASRRSTGYLLMLLITVAVYTGGFYALLTYYRNTPGSTPLLGGAALALALALLFNPLLNLARRAIRRQTGGSRYDPGRTLAEYGQSISNILDMDVLAEAVIGLIGEVMEITHGALVTVQYLPVNEIQLPTKNGSDRPTVPIESGAYLLHLVRGLRMGDGSPAGGDPLSEGDLPASPQGWLSAKNAAVITLRREHHPLTQYEIDLLPRYQGMDPAERAWLDGLKMDVYVPIFAKGSWIGLLALGPKTSGDRYYDEDLALLQTLADQTAVALENSRLYEDLKQRNAENERLNADLKSANVELARLDQAKSDFINIASHELRTPLTQVMGFNDLLHEMIKSGEIEPATFGQMVGGVRKAARRLDEIVNMMFDVSKLEAQTLEMACSPLTINMVLNAAADTWADGLIDRQIELNIEGISSLPSIQADGKRLIQVFSNLIQNAIKSTPDGGQIRISGRVHIVETSISLVETSCR